MPGPVVVIDYHKGNLSSVERGIVAAGGTALVSDAPADIASASGLVLPGVGSFEDAMGYLRSSGQDEAILGAVGRGVPFLGICLGLQLLFDRGDERAEVAVSERGMAPGEAPSPMGSRLDVSDEDRWVSGLGIFSGSCTRLPSGRLKVPHVGWNQIDITEIGRSCPLLAGVSEGANFYFTHSYATDVDVDPAVVAARTHYGRSFASVVWRGVVFGTQFHPEKSSGAGLAVMRNFVGVVDAVSGGARS